MDVYWDGIYVLRDGQFTEIAHGNYGAEDNSNVQFDENRIPIYVYSWNEVSVTKQEYEEALAREFDVSAAQDVFDGPIYDYQQFEQILLE
ncbi:MAG: hypothetical protein OSJ58_10345 [Dysosmobacter sp.]|nr:hypothetical protein [Dysosmobacter sp.]